MMRPLSFDIKRQELEIEAAQVLSFANVSSMIICFLLPISRITFVQNNNLTITYHYMNNVQNI
jgi:hypothetical protein